MRVLLAHRFFPGHFSHVAQALAAASDEVVFLHAEGEGLMPGVRRVRVVPRREPASTTHHYLQPLERGVLLGQAAYGAATGLAARGFEPDIIYAHAGFGIGLYLKDAFPNIPLLGFFEWYYQARGSDADHFDPFGLGPDDVLRIRTLNAGLLLELDAVDQGVVPTLFQRGVFPPEFRTKLEVLHDGIDTERFSPAAGSAAGPTAPRSRPWRVPPEAEVVLYAARGLEPYRGFPQFMATIARLQPERPRLHAVVLGADHTFYSHQPPPGRTWKELVLADLPQLDRDRVHFLETLPRDDYLTLLRLADVHVYLTVPFVLSWSLLEAMATGCAIVASDTAPVREVMADGVEGLLADLRDPVAIARCIARLLDDRALAIKLRTAARRRVERDYALSRLLPRQLGLLRRLADRGRAAGGRRP